MLNNKELAKVKKILGEKNESLSAVFSALSDSTRCHIFRSFIKQNKFCVSDIMKIMDISMSSASQHLKMLEIRGLVVKERRGRVIYYTLNHQNQIVKAIVNAVE